MIRRVLGNLYFLTFLNGFILASLFYFRMEATYEKDLFQAIRYNINNRFITAGPQDSAIVKIMHACHELLVSREPFFGGTQSADLESDMLESTSVDLMTARGACGSYSLVLARVLQGYKYRVRIAQMKVHGVFAAHNIVEVYTQEGWAVLDPLFDVYFRSPQGNLASFAEVKNNWGYYKNQVPSNYDQNYQYEDVRYTNWTKIPVLMPMIKKLLDLTIGKQKADGISLRTYFLRKYEIGFNLTLIMLLIVFSYTLFILIKAKVFPQKNIPVTFSNVYKYARLRFSSKNLSSQ